MVSILTGFQQKMAHRGDTPRKAQKKAEARSFSFLQIAAHLCAWIPLALLIANAQAGNLSVNPIQDATQRMGRAATLLLMSALSVTPVKTLTGIRQVQKLARPLGLYAFFYALIHLFLYVGLDYGFDPALLLPDLVNKPYIYIGIASFLILSALALTSFRWWMKRLGKHWKLLHRLVYAAGLLVVVHYALAVKGDLLHLRGNIGWPVFYGVLCRCIRSTAVSIRSTIESHSFCSLSAPASIRDIFNRFPTN